MDSKALHRHRLACRSALNANPVLSLIPCVRRTSQPTYCERILLLVLYFVTGLFVEHLALLYGPLCREAYDFQCGGAAESSEQLLPAGGAGARRLENDNFRTVGFSHGDLLNQSEFLKAKLVKASSSLRRELAVSRLAVLGILSGRLNLNCNISKCDRWMAGDANAPHDFHGDHLYEVLEIGGEQVMFEPGLCRCDRTIVQELDVRLAALASAFVFQNILISIFYALLSTGWESQGGCWRRLQHCTLLLIFCFLAVEMGSVFLIRFLPEAWLSSLGFTLLSTVTVAPALTYLLARWGCMCIEAELVDPPPVVFASAVDDAADAEAAAAAKLLPGKSLEPLGGSGGDAPAPTGCLVCCVGSGGAKRAAAAAEGAGTIERPHWGGRALKG